MVEHAVLTDQVFRLPSMLMAMPLFLSISVNATLVNWQPRSVLNIAGVPNVAMACARFSGDQTAQSRWKKLVLTPLIMEILRTALKNESRDLVASVH